ncbi:hypothetical protein SAMN04488094_103341 [Tropicimonas isoalkanivorans]|uniref:Uncharacterized protein n=2 Tax=Tropicimonas isoalkanivorans TaxID=441112 RepID=A0A1I1I0L5_9RHOB|nr:hypothetical protein SAMN04488094_103341 [Tropicimonas isoalkanivorans]
MEQGWGDGLPLIPPTEARVRGMIAQSGRFPDEVVAVMLPLRAEATVEKIAINAVMAGAPPEAMPLLIATVEAMTDPKFELASLNATTGSVVPAMIINGPIRHKLKIPFGAGCLGGVAGHAPAIGRAIRLLIRNVAGQQIDVTSQSTYGTPGRVAGIVFGEWEEKSPWAPLAERLGVKGDAVTVYGAMGTANICDMIGNTADHFLQIIGKSLAYPGANGFLPSSQWSEVLVAINPVWAEVVGKAYPNPEDVQQKLYDYASIPIDFLDPVYKEPIERIGRLKNGRVHLIQKPEEVFFMVAGGMGGLHAAMLHSWGTCLTTTRAIPQVADTETAAA